MDLSLFAAGDTGARIQSSNERHHFVLEDRTSQLWTHMSDSYKKNTTTNSHVNLIVDNFGYEIFTDLVRI